MKTQPNIISGISLTPVMEDYLEAIYNIAKEKRVVRVKDIAKRLGVKMPTVTNMLKTLSARGLIDYEKYEYLELTAKGHDVGNDVHNRHCILKKFLTEILSVDVVLADEDACKMEHTMSPATLKRLVEFVKFIGACPRAGSDWLDYFNQYCRDGREEKGCAQHMKKFVEDYSAKMG